MVVTWVLLSGLNAFVWVVTQVLLGGCYQSVTGWSERVCIGCYQSVRVVVTWVLLGGLNTFVWVVTRVLLSGLNAFLWLLPEYYWPFWMLFCGVLPECYWVVWMLFYGSVVLLLMFLFALPLSTDMFQHFSGDFQWPSWSLLTCLSVFPWSVRVLFHVNLVLLCVSTSEWIIWGISRGHHTLPECTTGCHIPVEHHGKRAFVFGGQHDFIFLFWWKTPKKRSNKFRNSKERRAAW